MSKTDTHDLIDACVPLATGGPLHALRRRRDKVVAASQGSVDAIFDPDLPGLGLAERFAAAEAVARLGGGEALAAHYRERRDACAPPADRTRLDAAVAYACTLARRPLDGTRAALLALPAAGLSTPDVVTLAQLIGLVAYQVRVVAGLRAMAGLDAAPAAAPAADDTVFVHPANLPAPGEPVRANGFTSEPLGWKAWLPVLDVAQASEHQLAVLKASHPTATTSDYYLTLGWQPRILEERSAAFNAIMYAPGGLSRAERELASTVVSRVNGCVYCAAVHALRFEQLARRNDVIVQVFEDPERAGTQARERAIVRASIALTRGPGTFDASALREVRAAGLDALEILDLVHAIAIFAWANRLMLNLGEPVFP
ncbi:MAG: peroxidase-related enzyme [Burkholderiaceae bacterium]